MPLVLIRRGGRRLVSGLFLAELERPAGGPETSQGWGGKGRNEVAGHGEWPARGFQRRGSQTRGKKSRKQESPRRCQQEQRLQEDGSTWPAPLPRQGSPCPQRSPSLTP